MSEQLKRAKEIVTAARRNEVEWTALEKSIVAELESARSDLARKVLAEIRKRARGRITSGEHKGGFIGGSNDVKWNEAVDAVMTAVCDLFTREQIDLGE